MNLLAKPNIFIFKITEPTCSYSDKHKGEKNSLETCASHSVTESESFIIAGPGFLQIWTPMQTLAMGREEPWLSIEKVHLYVSDWLHPKNKYRN